MNKIVFNFLMVLMLLLSNPANSQFSWFFDSGRLEHEVDYRFKAKDGIISIRSFHERIITIVKIKQFNMSPDSCNNQKVDWDKVPNYAAGVGKWIRPGESITKYLTYDKSKGNCFLHWLGNKD